MSVHLLTCFFQSAHTQMPVLDANNFSKRLNHANGEIEIMVLMANGGNQDFEAAIPSAPGLTSLTWSHTKESKVSTVGTLETLIACMQAAAAHYTDVPIVFGPGSSPYLRSKKPPPGRLSSSSQQKPSSERRSSSSQTANKRKKQGVACDPCRLRRVKCDYWLP